MTLDGDSRVVRQRIVLMLLVEFFWGIGTFLVLATTTIPAYLGARGARPVIIGVMTMAMCALPLLLQFFGRDIMNLFSRRKRGLILLHLPIIIPYFVMAALDALFAAHGGAMVVAAILVLSVAQSALGIVIPLWVDMIYRIIPESLRGRYFGFSAGAYAAGGIVGGSALAGLERVLGPDVYPVAFAAAGVCYLLSMGAFCLVDVPESAFRHEDFAALKQRLRTALAFCRAGNDFGRFVASNAVLTFSLAIVPFLVVFATDSVNGLGYPAGTFGTLTLLQAVGGSATAVILGWFVDRRGPKWPWVAAMPIIPVVLLMMPAAHTWTLLAPAALLSGSALTPWAVSGPALLEYSPQGDKSTYIAVANLIGFVPAAIGPLLFGAMIEGPGYYAAFAVSAACAFTAMGVAITIRGGVRPVPTGR